MSVKERGKGNFYLYFRPFQGHQVGLKVDVATRTEARQLEAILTRACRTGNYADLDPTAKELCVRLFRNQSWQLPPELGEETSQTPPNKELTLLAASKLFLQYPEIKAKTKKALDGYEQALVNIGGIVGVEKPLKELWVPDLKSYQQQRLSKGAAPSTINTELSALSRVFAVMIEMRLVEINPVRLVKRLSTKANEREVYLSRSTVQEIADQCPPWYQMIIWCSYFSAMRRGEILGLTRRQVNLGERMIYLQPEGTKEKRRKRVPIHRELVPVLEQAMRTPFLASDKVFLVQDHQGIREPGVDTVGNPWPRALVALDSDLKKRTEAGEDVEPWPKPWPRFHDLRHTWKTNARRSGMHPELEKSIMGHADRGRSVHERYGHVSDKELIAAIDLVTFDHGETTILAVQRKRLQAEKKCEHFVNIGGAGNKKRTQACPESLMISGAP